jgi:hypothetical protein
MESLLMLLKKILKALRSYIAKAYAFIPKEVRQIYKK